MTEIVPLLFENEHLVRYVMRDGEPWFVLADICRLLGIAQPASAARSLQDDEKGMHNMHTLGGEQQTIIVSEGGMYLLVFRSRKPEAIKFRRWVTDEVLPSIRKTGRYEATPEVDAPPERAPITHADIPLDLLRSWTHIIREARILRGPRAAMAVWNTSPLADLMPMPDMPPADLDDNGLHYTPQRGDPACLDHLLAARLLSGAPCLRDMLAGYFDAATTPARRNDIREALRPLGVLIEPIGWQNAVAVARRSQVIKGIYRGTEWQESWPVMLLQLRGVHPGGQHRFGEQNSRTVLLPKRLIVD